MGSRSVQDRVVISNNSLFEGNITASNITVEGEVVGNLNAVSAVVIKNGGQVEGNIQADKFFLEKGCAHTGRIYLDDSTPKYNLKEQEPQSNPSSREPGNNQSDKQQFQAVSAPANK